MNKTIRTILSLLLAVMLTVGTAASAGAAVRYKIIYGCDQCPEGCGKDRLNELLADGRPDDERGSRNCAGGVYLNELLKRFGYCRDGKCSDSAPETTEAPAQKPTEKATEAAAKPTQPAATQPALIPTEPDVKPTEAHSAQTESGYKLNDYEKEVVVLINKIRRENGLNELTIDTELSRVARIKSQDMRDNGYFSHTSPTYGSPFDMMKSFGIKYRSAGENIAMGYRTPQSVVDGWMNSPGHRANILNSSFSKIGMGYIANGNYWTQMFIG